MMNLKGLIKGTALILIAIAVLAPALQLIAEDESENLAEISQQLLSMYFQAYSFVLNRLASFNTSLETNLSIRGVHRFEKIELNESTSIRDSLNLSYSLVTHANMLLSEGNYSGACLFTKEALNILRFVLAAVYKTQKPLNQTNTSSITMINLQVAFERHKRLLTRINLSIQKLQNLTKINITLVNDLFTNISTMLKEGSRIAIYNVSQALKILSEANKAIIQIEKEVAKSSQIAKVEDLFNRTISKD